MEAVYSTESRRTSTTVHDVASQTIMFFIFTTARTKHHSLFLCPCTQIKPWIHPVFYVASLDYFGTHSWQQTELSKLQTEGNVTIRTRKPRHQSTSVLCALMNIMAVVQFMLLLHPLGSPYFTTAENSLGCN
jgi:hypothetical protein